MNFQDIRTFFSLSHDTETAKHSVMDFMRAGVACHCLTVLQESGILEQLIKHQNITLADIEKSKNPVCIRSVMVTLISTKIILQQGEAFQLTEFGRELAENIGLIKMYYDGYAELVAKQTEIVNNKIEHPETLLRPEAIAKASQLLADNIFDPVFIDELKALKLSGSICDLGCGLGATLIKLCQVTGMRGIGFEQAQAVTESVEKSLPAGVEIHAADITNLQGIWPEVTVIIQCHVFHDFLKHDKFVRVMNSYKTIFPNHQYFLYMDSVAPSPGHENNLPGFDYVHGLLGIETPTYQETITEFAEAGYQIMEVIELSQLPNTFLWVLKPIRLS